MQVVAPRRDIQRGLFNENRDATGFEIKRLYKVTVLIVPKSGKLACHLPRWNNNLFSLNALVSAQLHS
jgi:hypothetical protein